MATLEGRVVRWDISFYGEFSLERRRLVAVYYKA